MEEEKAAAYYDELTRKGGGAARFKQGLGFSSSSSDPNDVVPARGSALPSSSSSFLSSFVRASKASDVEKQSHIQSVKDKLKKKHDSSLPRVSDDRSRESDRHPSRRRRSRSRSRSRDDNERSKNRHRHRSSSRDRDRDRYGDRDRDRYRDRDRDRERDRGRRRRSRSRSRSVSPRRRRSEKSRDVDDDRKSRKEKTGGVDYAKSIDGYDKMSPAERVKAKMKLQLSSTAKQDEANGMGSGWERFNFDKDAPLDDEEIEAAEDDGALVKHIGQTFRFSAVEAKREEKIKATHDEAIFGTSSLAPPLDTDSEGDGNNCTRESPETAPVTSLISDQVRTLQQGSWRDRIQKA
ncbi:hypothetical protein HanRHA438_Chr08g0367731 [Helianthus annuus]|uniref:Uncharacterized protein n=1 Tax=Helianthus annuus TaxID=4232 RepID=A0A251SG52_HELAN|nr:serine/threonine-protein kinase fray2 [Helianthus annuus]XP_022009481.1 serine/threonine-protein kinase fray2 [Helianthus annuus]KAF5796760.1 hypothetical protein HanXRQr2_Chr08g0355601 [Helianthus annuus]KAJ0540036.1 hypothetical protein HanHA300_Chr08g0293621 [Helianthus annuus]KAJ0548430.1 hypothetical protein HanIR_Chr08g0383711 [Helianthus annuus]KAJ0554776.1 hypothetical protein HanHA89_Chr08g0312101 [Helianthus annuus]KAJ0720344.1 hypothetical protein HanLR1_Chr08g0292451 [Helianthu